MEKEQIQYITILKAARATLEGREPEDVAEKAGIIYNPDTKLFTIETYGREITLSYPDWGCQQEISPWHLSTLIQYLGNANGITPSGEYMPLREFKDGGHIRGASFDTDFDKMMGQQLGKYRLKDIQAAGLRLGGEIIKGKGDLSMVFHFMPHFPVLMNYWEPDDEFPASGRLLCDTTAENFLGVEAAGFAMELVLDYMLDIL